MKLTLNQIKKQDPCREGWRKLLKSKPGLPYDEEFSILDVLQSNGLADALWCLDIVSGYAKEKRLFAVWCARQAQHLMADPRSIAAIDVAESFANGTATQAELAAARANAVAAYNSSGSMSRYVAFNVVHEDVNSAAYYAAEYSVPALARAASGDDGFADAYDIAEAEAVAKQTEEFKRMVTEIESRS